MVTARQIHGPAVMHLFALLAIGWCIIADTRTEKVVARLMLLLVAIWAVVSLA
jgi:hypothetical protein